MAFSGSQKTRLGLYGGARPAYAGFVAKETAPESVTPAGRTFLIPADQRVFVIPQDART